MCLPFEVNHHSVETVLGKHDGGLWAGEEARASREREQEEIPGPDYGRDTSSEGTRSQMS